MHTVKTEAIDLSQVVVQQIIPTEKFFHKKNRNGEVVNNHYPGMYAVICHYNGNPRYVFIATDKELSQLQCVTPKQVSELTEKVKELEAKLSAKGK